MPVERLRIGRFHVNCVVAHDHPEPERLRGRLAEVVETTVPRALASIADRAFSQSSDGLWFIQRLDLTFDINAALDPDDLAHAIAVYTVRALADEMSATDANVVRFETPVEYLAAFLTDLADGTAWQRWYYRTFDGLELLPTSAAIRTAVCDDLDTGLAALRHVRPHALRRILDRLSGGDAHRILEAVEFQAAPAEITATAAATVEAALQILTRSVTSRTNPEQLALLLIIDSRETPLPVALCRALATLARLDRDSAVRRAVASSDMGALAERIGMSCAEVIAPLLTLPATLRAQLAEQPELSRQTTAYGGAFFLLPLIDTTPWSDGILRWSILLACFPDPAALRDPLLRQITGAEPDLPPIVEPEIDALAAGVLADFANRLPGFAESSRDFLFENFLACDATIEREEHRSIVTIGRAPLRLILNIAGINRQHYELSWFRGHRFELYPATD
jgi:hypothetical protein